MSIPEQLEHHIKEQVKDRIEQVKTQYEAQLSNMQQQMTQMQANMVAEMRMLREELNRSTTVQ